MINRNDLPDDAFSIIKDGHKLLRHHGEDGGAVPYLVDFGINNVDYLPISDEEKSQVRTHLEEHKTAFEKPVKSDENKAEDKKEDKSDSKGKSEKKVEGDDIKTDGIEKDAVNEEDLIPEDLSEAAVWSTATVNNFPDSSFAVVEKGGKKDDGGKTKPRNYRHLPYKDAGGKVDLPHLRNALARMNQIKAISSKDSTERIQAVAKRVLIAAAKKYLPGSKFTKGELLGAEAKILNSQKVGEVQYIDVSIEVSPDGPQVSIPFDVGYNKDGEVAYVKMYSEMIPGEILKDIVKFLSGLSKK